MLANKMSLVVGAAAALVPLVACGRSTTARSLDPMQAHAAPACRVMGTSARVDPVVPPRDSTGYYERVKAEMGDPRDFYRLFMAPGMLHCDSGPGPNALPTLAKLAGDNPAGAVVRTKPLCPYPQVAKWDGKGDRKRAESYRCEASGVSAAAVPLPTAAVP